MWFSILHQLVSVKVYPFTHSKNRGAARKNVLFEKIFSCSKTLFLSVFCVFQNFLRARDYNFFEKRSVGALEKYFSEKC